MVGILIGILLGAIFLLLLNHSKAHKLNIKWWAWGITIIWLIYTGFVLKMIEGFVDEHAFRAALVIGSIFGIISIISAVLLSRFVFFKSQSHE